MSWFDQKKRISESELIAYHLHELPSRRERAVAQALESGAALAADSAAIEATLHAVKDAPTPIDQAAFTRAWAALQPHLKPYAVPLTAQPQWQTPALAKAALAGLAAVGVGFVATRHGKPPRGKSASALSSNIASTTNAPLAPEQAPNRTGSDLAGTITPRSGSAPAVPPPGMFHVRLSTDRSSLKQRDDVPSAHLSPPQPAPLEAQTAISQPQRTAPEDPAASLATPPTRGEVPAGNNAQTSSAADTGARKTKLRGWKLPLPPYGSDAMLALGGTFITSHTSLVAGTEPYTQTATHAIAAVGAFHQQLRPFLGYRVTLSYTRPDFQYSYKTSTGGTFGGQINSRIFEAAGTYVVRGPHRGRLSTAADAGVALMAFLPTQDPAASYAYRAAAVLGASADYSIGKHWAARATYRAQLFRPPNFRYNGGPIPVTTSLVVGQEPSVGLVYRFGKTVPHSPKP